MSLLEDLASYIVSTDATLAGKVFLGRLSDTPAAQVALAETGGPPGGYVMASRLVQIEQPRVQVSSRSTTYADAANRLKAVERVLEGLDTRTINGVLYHSARALQPAFSIGYDQNNRPLLAQNFQIQKARSGDTASLGGTDSATVTPAESGEATPV